ncbi:MAG: DUF1501 domain-containing protein [Planctomycetaceae bacterium]|nr:DUF1501 domain-containing protein [Planctomycetaceae bacterium]
MSTLQYAGESSLCSPHEHAVSRRQLLGATASGAGLGLLSQPALAEAMKQKEKQVLFVWIDGAMSQLESWDPKPNTQFGGPFRAIPTSVPGLHFSELLPRTAKQAHHLTIVRNLCTKDNAHSSGVDRIQRGDPKPRGPVYPYFGSAVAKLLGGGPSGLPPYVWIKPMSGGFVYKDAGFMGPKYGALAFGDAKPPENLLRNERISNEEDLLRNELRAKLNERYKQRHEAKNVEANSFVYDVAQELMKRQDLFDESKISAKDKERYGTHELGRHMLMGRRMLEAGVRFVKVNTYGWDTHGDNFNGHASLVPRFDQAFAAIIEDLAAAGMLENVLVIAMSEFGRTPRINGHIGRDHWPEAWSLAMAGTGLKHGHVHGKTNAQGTWVSGEEHDIGAMFHTWFSCLGIDSKKTMYDNNGQPLPLAHDDMFPVKDVLA